MLKISLIYRFKESLNLIELNFTFGKFLQSKKEYLCIAE